MGRQTVTKKDSKNDATAPAAENTSTPENTDQPKGRVLKSRAAKKAEKATTKKAKGEGTRVNVPTPKHFEELRAEIAKCEDKVFKGNGDKDEAIRLRALYDRGFRWARKMYENEDIFNASVAAAKAQRKAAKEAASS